MLSWLLTRSKRKAFTDGRKPFEVVFDDDALLDQLCVALERRQRARRDREIRRFRKKATKVGVGLFAALSISVLGNCVWTKMDVGDQAPAAGKLVHREPETPHREDAGLDVINLDDRRMAAP